MENSILTSTKKVLGLSAEYTAFDQDIITHINSTFSILNQFGVGPIEGFGIEDAAAEWADFVVDPKLERMVRTYMFLKVRMLFDPPGTSFLISAMNDQIQEHEHRLIIFIEDLVSFPVEE